MNTTLNTTVDTVTTGATVIVGGERIRDVVSTVHVAAQQHETLGNLESGAVRSIDETLGDGVAAHPVTPPRRHFAAQRDEKIARNVLVGAQLDESGAGFVGRGRDDDGNTADSLPCAQ